MTENRENSNNSKDSNFSNNTPGNSNPKSKSPDHTSSDYVDMVLNRKGSKVVDSETLVKGVDQARGLIKERN